MSRLHGKILARLSLNMQILSFDPFKALDVAIFLKADFSHFMLALKLTQTKEDEMSISGKGWWWRAWQENFHVQHNETILLRFLIKNFKQCFSLFAWISVAVFDNI